MDIAGKNHQLPEKERVTIIQIYNAVMRTCFRHNGKEHK